MYRQLYATGGISSLSQAKNLLQKHAPEGEHLAYINPQEAALLRRHGGSGIMTVAGIPSFGLLKTIRNIIPNEVGKIASVAAPFVAAVNPLAGAALAAFGSFDQTGKLGDVVKSAAINYGLGQAGRFIGGADFQTGFNPFDAASLGSNASNFMGVPYSSPIGTESGLKLGQYDVFKSPTELQNARLDTAITNSPLNQMEPFGGSPDFGNLSPATTSGGSEGYLDLGKKIVSPDTELADRFSAIKDLGGKALKDIYTTPVRDASGKVIDYNIDKTSLIATLSGASTYIEAKQKADDAGLTDSDFNEQIWQQSKVNPIKTKYQANLNPSSFGITNTGGVTPSSFGITTARDGGRIGFDSGGMSNSRITQLLQLLEEAQMKGDQDKVDIIRAELNTMKKADGGRIGYESGDLVLEEGPMNKETRLQMERAAKKAQSEYAKRKAQEKLMDENYKKWSEYDSLKGTKELFDMAPDEGYPPMPEPKRPNEGVLSIKLTPAQKKALGGIINNREHHLFGNLVGKISSNDPNAAPMNISGEMSSVIKQILQVVNPANPIQNIKQPYTPSDRPVNDLYQYYLNKENDDTKRNQILEASRSRFNKADGGVMDIAPMRMLHGGIPEMDLRAKGGYVPYGIKERADDVPAMLSKNEFVFTADAVRNAGDGSINKGAQKMYKLMKSLENKRVNKRAN
jgi:hypothetical protein